MSERAYTEYGFLVSARLSSPRDAFQSMVKKYPSIPKERILADLAARSKDSGRYFAVAVEAKLYELALKFAVHGTPDPMILSEACYESAAKNPHFAHSIGQIAMQRYLDGQGECAGTWDWATCFQPLRRSQPAHRRTARGAAMGNSAGRSGIPKESHHGDGTQYPQSDSCEYLSGGRPADPLATPPRSTRQTIPGRIIDSGGSSKFATR